ncbi:D-aspartate oxidase isoform X1 [Procambarus clarkii]|uniref:D-aspartate oxidase isoform X1 n=2 Tax=Procambarus clarkii TaxID=6728 RepID=UPI003744A701
MVVRVVVVGGGVSGVGSALALLQRLPQCSLTIIAEHFTPTTTGDGAAGHWEPYMSPGTSEEKIIQWSRETWELFRGWWESGRQMGVSLAYGEIISRDHMQENPWRHVPLAYRTLTDAECTKYGPQYRSGYTFGTFSAEVSRFLPVLLEEVKELGGRLEVRRLSSLTEAAQEADLVINCSGLGARDLVPDPAVYPCRGQVMRVRAPWVGRFLCDESDESFAYILPNIETVVVGGTHQDDDWRLEVDPADSRVIWDNCTTLMPSLKAAVVVQEWVGLRPCRKGGVRLEADQIKVDSRTVPVVHNYGHGGCGITMFWGCASEVAHIARDLVHRHYGLPCRL